MDYWRYIMQLRVPPNARSEATEVEGALVRIGDGIGCLHPWTELGDLPLDDQLDALGSGVDTSMTKQCRYCCSLDGAARRKGVSLFEGVVIPPSHGIWIDGMDEKLVENFSYLKLKCGPEVVMEAERLRDLAAKFPEVGWRIDFNGLLDRELFQRWMEELGDDMLERIDFVEDPIPYEPVAWNELQEESPFDLALDRGKNGARINVVKPLVDEVDTGAHNTVVTSYMDHPVGQAFAAFTASRFRAPLRGAGLLTHWLFEPDPFTLSMRSEGESLVPPDGTGLGFDELLDELEWKRL